MKTVNLEVPTMFGDHHVIEVRRLLLDLEGVEEVYASSAFQVVEISYDESKLDRARIEETLESAGYLGELQVPVESGVAAQESRPTTFFRHTAAYEQTREVVSFAQKVPFSGRPLWPCPGFGPILQSNGEEEV